MTYCDKIVDEHSSLYCDLSFTVPDKLISNLIDPTKNVQNNISNVMDPTKVEFPPLLAPLLALTKHQMHKTEPLHAHF